MDNINLALEFTIIGMVAVYAILLIVIYGGKLLIALINKVAPEEDVQPKRKVTSTPSAATTAAIDAETMGVLRQAVAQITDGKGRIAKVEKF